MAVSTVLAHVLEWYRGAGNIKSVKRGLDDRSLIFEISGRREMRILAVIYDPASDESLHEFVDDIMDSYGRAGTSFDRLDLWVPESFYSRAQELLEEAERRGWKWSGTVTLRPLSAPLELNSFELDERKRPSSSYRESKVRGKIEGSKRISEERVESKSSNLDRDREIRALIQEMGREIGEGIAKSLEESFKALISSIDLRRGDPELISKIYELEKRIELLESFIRFLGTQGNINYTPQTFRELTRGSSLPKQDFSAPAERTPSASVFSKPEERMEIAVNTRDSREVDGIEDLGEAEDVLAEIFNNPWVSILRKKGDEIESEDS